MPFLLNLALGWGWGRTAARVFSWAAPILILLAAIGGGVWLIYAKGESAGSAKEQVRVEKAHAKTITEARGDEKAADATAGRIAERVRRVDDTTTDLVRSKITEMHDAIHSAPPAGDAGGTAPAVVDTGRVSASLNDLVSRANGSADAADAVP